MPVDQKLIDEVAGEEVVTLFTAVTQEDEPFYCYIKLTVKKLGEFVEARERGEEVDLTTLGEIVARGWGDTPPQDVHTKIQEEYGDVQSS